VSDQGLLAHQAALRPRSQAVLVDRGGREIGTLGSAGDISDIAVSPDGRAVAVSLLDTTRSARDLWVYPTAGGPGRRVTFDAADDFAPVWSPDGARLLFSSLRQGLVDLAADMRHDGLEDADHAPPFRWFRPGPRRSRKRVLRKK
jgi:dipeptidyl aminopeptidase/acylaminoacyl peptidase